MEKTLSIVPDQLIFRDSNIGEVDSIDVWVTNISDKPTQIRYFLEKNSKFEIVTSSPPFTPPGLETKAVLRYKCTSNDIIKEKLIIQSPNFRQEIPILALPPSPRIIPDNDHLEMPQIGIDTTSKITFSISNFGTKEGHFNITCDSDTLEFIPNNGTLLPNKSCDIAATIHPRVVGDFEHRIRITADGQVEEPSFIIVRGKAINHSLVMMIDEKEVNSIDFQTIFMGQKRVVEAKIVNTGPYKRSFVIMPPHETPRTGSRAEKTAQYMSNSEDLVFKAYPAEGTLNPYASSLVRFVFNPPIDSMFDGDSQVEFKHYSSVEIVETSQNIPFQMTGNVVQHLISIPTTDFFFDTISVMSKAVKVLTIKNMSKFLPTSFVIKPIAHFRFEPSKGVIQPNQSKNINIVFYPKTLGDFQMNTKIIFNDGLVKKNILLAGKSTQTGKDLNKFKRVDPWEESEEVKYRAQHPNEKYTYGVDKLKKNKDMRKKFDEYLSGPREKREERRAKTELQTKLQEKTKRHLEQTIGTYTEADYQEYMQKLVEEEAFDDNMDDYGMVPPDPPLRNLRAPLAIDNPERFGLISRNQQQDMVNLQGNQTQNNETILIKKKFKPKATTPHEINECSHPLTPAQQLLVTASHETLNLGEISVFSTVARSFAVTNNLQQSIIVTVNYEYDELSGSGPASQVIPPKQTAGFDIIFCSTKPQNFMKTITYTVNGVHSYSVNIVAQVIPIELQLSKSVLEFRFAGDSTVPTIREFVTIYNKNNADAQYSWSGVSEPFSISTEQGFVEANQQINVEITYTPTTKSHDEQTVILNVAGGQSKAIKLVSDIGSPKCTISKKSLQFGLIPIGIMKTQQIRLKNSSDDDAIFSIANKSLHELTIIPSSGRVGARETQTIQVSFKAIQARVFDIPVTISICGAQPITFSVTGQSELPKIVMTNPEFDFGRVYVGSYQSLEGTIKNVGAIPAILFLDLSNHPEFRIESNNVFSNGENEKVNSISLVSDPFFVTKCVPASDYIANDQITGQSSQASLLDTTRTESANEPCRSESSNGGLIYKIQIMDNSQVSFKLVFQPINTGDHSFELPVTMMNMNLSSSTHLQPIVCAEAVRSPLMISTSSLDFGVRPVYDPLNPNMRKEIRTLSIFNESNKDVEWKFGSDKDNEISSAFTIEPSSGTLGPGSSTSVRIHFAPTKNVPHNYYVPLIAKGKDEAVIAKVQLTGVGTNNMFSVSNTDICFPAVPLNTKVQLEINIINDGYIDGLLKTTMSADENQFPVKITFPESNQLQHHIDKIPLLITFQSSKPTSFSVNVAVTDDNGHACNFTVTCTADNSIFTLFSYYSNKYKSSQMFSEEEFNKYLSGSELTARFISSNDFVSLKSSQWNSSFSPVMIKFVQRYFNTLLFSTQLADIPENLISNQGLIITEMIANFHPGKRVSQQEDRENTAVEDELPKRMEAIKKLINTLKGMGALLGSIRPEFLLPRNDFIQIMRNKIMKQQLGLDTYGSPSLDSLDQNVLGELASSKSFSSSLVEKLKALECLYNQLSKESWMIVLLQCFKIFGLSRVQSDKFSSIPGVQNVLKQIKSQKNPDDIIGIMNKKFKEYSMNPHESAILKWLSLFAINESNDQRAIQSNFRSLSDGYAFSVAMKYHTALYKSTPTFLPKERHQREQNAIDFANTLKMMKLNFSPLAEEIVLGDSCINAMIGAYLIEIIPHFIPMSTIDFSGPLHNPIVKSVSLTNPSKSEIKYNAILEGDSNYKLLTDSIIVGPNQTVDIPVQYLAKTTRTLTGRLTLIPGKPRYISQGESSARAPSNRLPTYSAPIVVDLVSNISINSSDCTLNINTPLYQECYTPINVKNILGIPARLHIYTHVTRIADENGKETENAKTLIQQVSTLVANHKIMNDYSPQIQATYDQYIKNHKSFVVSQKTIEFRDNENEITIDLDFIPIKLGTYRCVILFIDDEHGEFIYEVIGKSTLPQATDCPIKIKTEEMRRFPSIVPVELVNPALIHALSYSIERINMNRTNPYNRKIKNEVTKQQHTIENVFRSTFTGSTFKVVCSATQFFEVPAEMQTKMVSLSTANLQTNTIPIVFKPQKAGEYPCRLILFSEYDVRVISVKAVGLYATKELSVGMQTVIGKSVKQELPFNNPSDESWQYKVTIQGDSGFTAQSRFMVKAKSTSSLLIQFNPSKAGTFKAEMNVVNVTKESTIIYKLNATVEEPPAEDKIVINAQARKDKEYEFKFTRFTLNPVHVTSTVPVIKFKEDVAFDSNNVVYPVTISAPRSGISVGTITFTDVVTKAYIWYIMEIHITAPIPEQTLRVETVAKQRVSVSIPVSNPMDRPAYFKVSLQDPDVSGEKEFIIPPNGSYNYSLVVSPLKAVNKIAPVYFYSDDDGEFWYNIQIVATDPEPKTIVPMAAPIGRYASTFIQLENPADKQINFRIENDNPTIFPIMAKKLLTLLPLEKKRLEIRYIPSSVGNKETANISLRSSEVGDWIYKVTGTGKPPLPLSPTIISSVSNETSSALILFTNPFSLPAKFSVTMTTDSSDVFSFLLRKKNFTLNNFGEEFQIPFTFSPKELGQYTASIIIVSQGPGSCQSQECESIPSIRWVYPIIGNSIVNNFNETKCIKARSNEPVESNIEFTLVGESEHFKPSEYIMKLDIPQNMEFLKTQLSLTPVETKQSNAGAILVINSKFLPMRPIQCTTLITIKNKIDQEWQFKVEIIAELGKPVETVVIESLLGKIGTAHIKAPSNIHGQKPFHAYFTASSASELTVSPNHGIAIPGTNVPIEIQFLPKTYGKVLKGVLVLDMIDSLYTYDIIGKMPEYVPPVVAHSSLARMIKNPRKSNVVVSSSAMLVKPRILPNKD